MKYYLYNNANRRLKLGKFTFVFDVVDQFAGAWRGILATGKPGEIATIEAHARRLGIVELPEAEYEELKKKAVAAQIRSLQRSGLRPTNMRLGSDKPAVTVVDRRRPSQSSKAPDPKKDLPEASEVLTVGTANIVDNLDKPTATRRSRRKTE